jgi:hypothetical protein
MISSYFAPVIASKQNRFLFRGAWSAFAAIPNTAPFSEEDVKLLKRVVARQLQNACR